MGGKPEGAPNLPDVPQLFGDELGWTAGLQREDSRGRSPVRAVAGTCSPRRCHTTLTPSSLLLNHGGSCDVFLGGGGCYSCLGTGCRWQEGHGERLSAVTCTPLCHLSMSQQPSAPLCKWGCPQTCHQLPWHSTVRHVPKPSWGFAVCPCWLFPCRSHSWAVAT